MTRGLLQLRVRIQDVAGWTRAAALRRRLRFQGLHHVHGSLPVLLRGRRLQDTAPDLSGQLSYVTRYRSDHHHITSSFIDA